MSRARFDGFLRELKGSTIHLVGLAAVECSTFIDALVTAGIRGFVVHDLSADIDGARRSFETTHVALTRDQRAALWSRIVEHAAEIRLADRYLDGVSSADWLYVPQSWDLYPANDPLAPVIAAKPGRVLTLMQLYSRYLPCPTLGITGTNGKTSTTTFAVSLLESAGRAAMVGGNHRYHAQSLVGIDDVDPNSVAVLELSHKHLANIERGPDVAVVTNLSGDHLDEMGGLEPYLERKRRILATQDASAWRVLNVDDARVAAWWADRPERTLAVSLRGPVESGPGAWLTESEIVWRDERGDQWRWPRADVRLVGPHNWTNALLALAATSRFIADPEALGRGLATLRAPKHRLEFLRTIAGVRVYDDTASTSPSAAAAALRAFDRADGAVVIVIGGDDKSNDYEELRVDIEERATAVVVLPGTAPECLFAQGEPAVPVVRVADLPAAIEAGLKLADGTGSLVVSPAGAGFHSAWSAAGSGTGAGGLRNLIRKWGRS